MRGTVATTWVLLAIALAPAASAQQQWVAPREMAMPVAGFVAPDSEALRHELPGGAFAYVVRDDLVPLLRFRALIGAGHADGPGGADYAAALRRGPASLAPADFADLLASMAALYEVEQDETETRLTLEVPSEDLVLGLGLFGAILRGRLSGESRADSGTNAAQPAAAESGPALYEGSLAAAVELFEQELFGTHPYNGTYQGEARGDAAAFRERFVVPANIVLAVSGDFDVAEMREALSMVFTGWSGDAPSLSQHPMPEPIASRRVHTFPVDKLQGWVVLGHELPPVPGEDEAALMVMNYVLGGGHFDTRLFRATRDRRGLTNDDSGFPEPGFRGPGVYTFRTYGRPEVVRLLIQLTLQEIERIRTGPVSDEDLFVARGALADGEFSLWFRDGAATATTYAREWLRYGDHSRTASWQERVRGVTADDVLAAARRYLHPERMQIVVLGPIDAVRGAPSIEGEPSLEQFESGDG